MHNRLCAFLPLSIVSLQIVLCSSNEGLSLSAQAALQDKVHDLWEQGRQQAAEIELLRQHLASAGIEIQSAGASVHARRTEEVAPPVIPVPPIAQEPAKAEAAKKEEKESVEGEEEAEEEVGPVDLTLAISLLGYITVVMTMFKLCNHDDEDMRIYVWKVLSMTLSIFLAVLLFTTLNAVCHLAVPKGGSVWITIVIDLLELILCFTLMQISVAVISGSFEKAPFDNPDDPNMSIEEQKRQRERRFKSVATLFAHMSGFAAINFGGGLQHLPALQAVPVLTFTVPPLLFAAQVVLCRLVRKVRTGSISRILAAHDAVRPLKTIVHANEAEEAARKKDGSPQKEDSLQGHFTGWCCSSRDAQDDNKYQMMKPLKPPVKKKEDKEGIEWCVDKWDEETYESENEVSSLAISFLLLQAIRYNLTGIMPDNIGIEEEHWKHPQIDVFGLIACGVLLAVLCIILVVISVDKFPEDKPITPGSFMSFLKRVVLVAQGTSAMGFAWALMYTSKWQLTIFLPELNPNAVTPRVLLAGIVTIMSFFIIQALDMIADLKSTGEKTDKAIVAIITSLSTLVGFAWEQSFDGAVEVLSADIFKAHPIVASMAITACIFYLVYPQWRRYILKKLLALQEDKKRKEELAEGS